MILKHPRFSQLIRDPKWMAPYVCTIIDEAHCIVNWGKSFRKEFSEIEKLRSFMSNDKPFLIASATLPPLLLSETLDKLEYQRNRMFLVNLGNNRPNVTPVVIKMGGGAKDLSAVDWILHEARKGAKLIRTIVYSNTREITTRIFEHLLDQLDPQYRDQLDFIHGRRSKRAKDRVMRRFRAGDIRVLIATEVAGMVRCRSNPELDFHSFIL